MADERKPAADLAPKHVQKHVEIVHYVNEPARLCSNCEHWKAPEISKGVRRCHNGISGKARTSAKETCRSGFYPSVERFPLEKRYHQG